MIPFTLNEITLILSAKKRGKNRIIRSIETDSRSIEKMRGTLFIALKGKKFDAHDFIFEAINSGAIAILVEKVFPVHVTQIIVSNTRRALNLLGAWMRNRSTAKVIAITGSAGKTSVKEMTVSILENYGNVLANKKNFNNDIGISITLFQITKKHDYVVLELGANRFGEIFWMSKLVRPDVALVNNISQSHLEGFKSLSGVARAKGEIFSGLSENGLGIFNSDSIDWKYWKNFLGKKKFWAFSLFPKNRSKFYATDIIRNNSGTRFTLNRFGTEHCSICLSLLGDHNISNAIAASALATAVGTPISIISDSLSKIGPIPGRLFPIHIGYKKLLIDDTYNANLGSIRAAIKVLSRIPGYRVMVIGDVSELGKEEDRMHRKIGKILSKTVIQKVLSIGNFSFFISQLSKKGIHFKNRNHLIFYLDKIICEYDRITILIKGSRNAKMEKIVNMIVEKNGNTLYRIIQKKFH